MSSTQRQQPLGVIERLLEFPYRFQFVQAVRMLERWYARKQGLKPSTVVERKLRFRNNLSLSFPPSEIAALRVNFADGRYLEGGDADAGSIDLASLMEDTEHFEFTPAFMSLLGVGGALPTVYTEIFAQRELIQRDASARAFLDVFTNRSVAVFCSAWKKHRLPVQYEADSRNHFSPEVLSLAGLGLKPLRDRLRDADGGIHDETLAYFSGTLQQRSVSAVQIQHLLSYYFRVPVRVEQFVGRWFEVPEDATNSLGLAHCDLSFGVLIGNRVWQRDLRMRIVLGPLSDEQYQRFLPRGAAARSMHRLLTLLSGITLEYEVRLLLRREDVRTAALGPTPARAQLGWDTFLSTRESDIDRQDAAFEIHAAA